MLLLIQSFENEEEKEAAKDVPKMPYFLKSRQVLGGNENHLLSKKIFIRTLKIIFNGAEVLKRHLIFQLYNILQQLTHYNLRLDKLEEKCIKNQNLRIILGLTLVSYI